MSNDEPSAAKAAVESAANSAAEVLNRKSFAAGATIFRAGQGGTAAYILLSGEVEIHRGEHEDGSMLAVIVPGQIFGELALLNNETRSATAVARSKCEVAVVSPEAFRGKLAKADPFIRFWVEYLSQRVLSLTDRIA
jgi:CRP/FNR family cyclic AMP-dependent transcriptional regulator